MGDYDTGRENGTVFKSSNSDFRILINRCANRDVGGQECVFTYVNRGEYYVRLGSWNRNYNMGSSRQPINISIDTIIEIYDRQMQSGNIEINWLDDYNVETLSQEEKIKGGCYACGGHNKSKSKLTSNYVKTDRKAYESGVFYPRYNLSSTATEIYSRRWHEDCVLSVLNPTINQVAQILEQEGALDYLRHNKSVHPDKFRD